MSTFSVPITTIREILPHNNANALEIAKVYDWNVVVRKGQYKVGDNVIYVPVDSILPWELEQKIFPPESKIKLNKSRIRSIKIRGQISQGMILDMEDVYDKIHPFQSTWKYESEIDVAEWLGITKYEPPVQELPSIMNVGAKKKKGNPEFKKYTDIENFKYYDRMFQDGEMVYVSEKLHGTSFRAGWFPMEVNTLWKKIKKFFGRLPKEEFCWGSRTVQIQVKGSHDGCQIESQGVNFDDVYTKIVKQYDLKNRIPKEFAIYGEIVGDGIQKGYTYGCGSKEHKLYVYDIACTYFEFEWQDHEYFKGIAKKLNLETVPELYVGPFNRSVIDSLRDGPSLIGNQNIREGIVIKPVIESNSSIGRKVLKYISDGYYMLKDGTDFH